jgi:hypothetical protein
LRLTAAESRTVRARNEYDPLSAIHSGLAGSPSASTETARKTPIDRCLERLRNRPKTNREDFAFVLPSADS